MHPAEARADCQGLGSTPFEDKCDLESIPKHTRKRGALIMTNEGNARQKGA